MPKPKKDPKRERLAATLEELYLDQEFVLADGFEDAFLGVDDRTLVCVYDSEKCVKILMKRDGMSREDAEEFFSFNVTGAYVGEKTPIFVWRLKPL